MAHPLVLVYGETSHLRFPLVLFVGREPNDSDRVGEDMAIYDFDSQEKVNGIIKRRSRCTFWNMAYKLVGEFGPEEQLTVRGLKDKCKEARSSIVSFADVSPRSIRSAETGKRIEREEMRLTEFHRHFEALIHAEIFSRVNLVLLAGSDKDGLSSQRTELETMLNEAKQERIAYQVPFLSTYSYEALRKQIRSSVGISSKIREVYDVWEHHRSTSLKYRR